jgi:uncharacterized protein (TIGR03435 family)
MALAYLLTLSVAGLSGQQAMQRGARDASDRPAKLAFEVASIHKNISNLPQFEGRTPDGYRMTNMSLVRAIVTADGSPFLMDRFVGLPDWVNNTYYNIDAKVSEADLAQWQNPALQPALLRATLQQLLIDRCKLQMHREMKEVAVLALTVGKSGPRFKESKPGDLRPTGIALPEGGVAAFDNDHKTLRFYGATMAEIAPFLSNLNMGGPPVQDNTGLTGKYDLALQWFSSGPSATGRPEDDLGPTIFSVVESLGLNLKQTRGPVETLVIDHLEPPSDN